MALVWGLPALQVFLFHSDGEGIWSRFPEQEGLREPCGVRKYVTIRTDARFAIAVQFSLTQMPLDHIFPGNLVRISCLFDGLKALSWTGTKDNITAKAGLIALNHFTMPLTLGHRRPIFREIRNCAPHELRANANAHQIGRIQVIVSHENGHLEYSDGLRGSGALPPPVELWPSVKLPPAFSRAMLEDSAVSHYIDFSGPLQNDINIIAPINAPLPKAAAWKTDKIVTRPCVFEFHYANRETIERILAFNRAAAAIPVPIAVHTAHPRSLQAAHLPNLQPPFQYTGAPVTAAVPAPNAVPLACSRPTQAAPFYSDEPSPPTTASPDPNAIPLARPRRFGTPRAPAAPAPDAVPLARPRKSRALGSTADSSSDAIPRARPRKSRTPGATTDSSPDEIPLARSRKARSPGAAAAHAAYADPVAKLGPPQLEPSRTRPNAGSGPNAGGRDLPSKKPRLDEAINTLKEISKEVAESPNDNVKPNKALQTHEMIKRDNPAAKSRTSETSGADKNATWPIDGGGKPSHESKVNKTDDAGKNVTESVGGTS